MVSVTRRSVAAVSLPLNKPSAVADANKTKANSPPGPSSMAASSMGRLGSLNIFPQSVSTANLTTINARAVAAILKGDCNSRFRSRLRPTIKKKNPSSRPLKGSMMVSMARRYSVSAKTRPAIKAPMAIDNPASVAAAPVPTAMNNTTARNRSGLLARATRRNNGVKA